MDSDGRTPHPPTHYSHPASSQPTSHPDCQTASVKVRVYIEAHRQTKNQKGRLDVRRAPRPRRGPRWRGGPRRTARRETASSRRGVASNLDGKGPGSRRGSATAARAPEAGRAETDGEERDGELTARCRGRSRRQGPRLTARRRRAPARGEGQDGRRGPRLRMRPRRGLDLRHVQIGNCMRGGTEKKERHGRTDVCEISARSNCKLHV